MHTREHRSLLAGAEKRLLIALAQRLPPWTTSDHLTLVALLAMPVAGGCFARIPHAPWSAAAFVVALACNWFGDSLDGTLARVRDQQRPRYGYYVDHVIDLAGAAALFAGIGASGLMHSSIAIALAAAYFLVAAESYLSTHARGVFRLSFAGFGPTELRIVLAAGAVIVVHKPWVEVFGVHARLFDVGGLVAIAGICISPLAARLLDNRYQAAMRVIPLVVLAYLLHAMFALFQLPIMQSKRSGFIFGASAVALASNLALNLLWIPRWGVYGAAWASVAAYAVEAGATYFAAQAVWPLAYRRGQIAAGLLLAALLAAATQFTHGMLESMLLAAFGSAVGALAIWTMSLRKTFRSWS